MPVRHAGPQALTPRGASVAPRHLGVCAGFVDEHQVLGIEIELAVEPGLAPPQDVGTVLLGCMG